MRLAKHPIETEVKISPLLRAARIDSLFEAPGPLLAGIVFVFIWVRATLPRLRYDQLMSFGWKILLPLATLNALVTAVLVVVTH